MTEADPAGKPDPIQTAFSEFWEAWFSGKPPDPDAFCERHPECCPELRVMIENFIFVDQGLSDAGEVDDEEACKAPVTSAVEEGQVLGDFKILRKIGSGGMGVVYEAEQVSLGRKVALKLLSSHLRFSKEAVQKFQREAEAGGRQSHPGIVSVYAVGEHEGIHYIAQELVPGGTTLLDPVKKYPDATHLPMGYFRHCARMIARVAYALQHAHEAGVIHRDVKPSNILLAGEGTPKVTDFGLARVEGALALSRTGDLAGTPCYMSPEQAEKRGPRIDLRTDIYSLGVTLYEMLTLKRPFDGDNTYEILRKIITEEPADPRKVNPQVPRDLAVICMKAMENRPEKRYSTMKAFGEDLERYLQGDVILARPAGPATRIGKRIKRNPVLSTALGLAAAGLLAFAVVVPWVVAQTEKKNTERVRKESEKAIAAKNLAVEARKGTENQARIAEDRLKEIVRLSDITRLEDLEMRAQTLWPAYPEKFPDLISWIGDGEKLVERLDDHLAALSVLREAARPRDEMEVAHTWEFDDVETQWRHNTLQELVSDLDAFAHPSTGTLKRVKDRLAFASIIKKRSIDDHREAWDRAIATIEDPGQCPMYKGRRIKEQIGLVPVGRDPVSGLYEFAHLQTGKIPERDSEGKLVLTPETGLVFVLIPAGTFNKGSMNPTKEHPLGSPNVDPETNPLYDGPVHPVEIKYLFFLSKYEMTQGQWLRFTGKNPGAFPKEEYSVKELRKLHPVERITWEECVRVLAHMKLRLPSESEWEYAARAGTTTIRWTGDDPASMMGAVNFHDVNARPLGDPSIPVFREWVERGCRGHAPVGCYRPNPFGLHEILGNVSEWCQDTLGSYTFAPRDGSAHEEGDVVSRVTRGGCWTTKATHVGSAGKASVSPDAPSAAVGVRPVADLK